MTAAAKPAERKKRTITEIRDSKHTGEKMVYTSVLDYTSAKWAEAAGVDVCVVGDSLAMTCHGHPSTVPATMTSCTSVTWLAKALAANWLPNLPPPRYIDSPAAMAPAMLLSSKFALRPA